MRRMVRLQCQAPRSPGIASGYSRLSETSTQRDSSRRRTGGARVFEADAEAAREAKRRAEEKAREEKQRREAERRERAERREAAERRLAEIEKERQEAK